MTYLGHREDRNSLASHCSKARSCPSKGAICARDTPLFDEFFVSAPKYSKLVGISGKINLALQLSK